MLWPATFMTQPSGAEYFKMTRPPVGLRGASIFRTHFLFFRRFTAAASSAIVRPVTVIASPRGT